MHPASVQVLASAQVGASAQCSGIRVKGSGVDGVGIRVWGVRIRAEGLGFQGLAPVSESPRKRNCWYVGKSRDGAYREVAGRE